MIGRTRTLGFSLLGALLLLAVCAQGAFAVENWTRSNETTAYTCSPGAATKDFEDAHCDVEATGKGAYGQEEIEPGQTTSIELTNNSTANGTTSSTPAVLSTDLYGIPVEIVAHQVSGIGWVENSSTTHDIEGTVLLRLSELTVITEYPECEIPEGELEVAFEVHGVEDEYGEMGLEYSPDPSELEGRPNTTFIGTPLECGGWEITVEIQGTAVGVGATPTASSGGTTLVFAESTEALEGAGPAAFDSALTTRMAYGGDGISTTTTR